MDLGAMHALWFSDPDGMKGEVCLIVDRALRAFHAPVPLAQRPDAPLGDV